MNANPSSSEVGGAHADAPAPSDATHSVSPSLRTGICVGALLNLVMIAALVAANRFLSLDSYALERNAASFGLFVILFLVPIVRFLNRPLRMFTAGLVGWALFVLGYDIAGMYFHNLFGVLRTPLEALAEGIVLYGLAAVTTWVIRMALHARHNPIAPRRRSMHHVAGHNR